MPPTQSWVSASVTVIVPLYEQLYALLPSRISPIDAYDGDIVCGYTNEPITKEAIRDYFKSISKEFDLKSEEGLKKYIQKQLAC